MQMHTKPTISVIFEATHQPMVLNARFWVKETQCFSVVDVVNMKYKKRNQIPCTIENAVSTEAKLHLSSQEAIQQFKDSGFVTADELISPSACAAICDELDCILRGELVGDCRPDKCPKGSMSCRTPSKKVLHMINTWKSSEVIKAVVTDRELGKLVAHLGGWSGARVAEDQVWIKPPGAGPLVFHRDSPYFDFDPGKALHSRYGRTT